MPSIDKIRVNDVNYDITGNLNIYSTDEQVIGKWINRQTFI